jgi:hypothetical protein
VATETLSELIIRFRTDGVKDARAAIARALADAQKQQTALLAAQKAGEEKRRADRLKFLQTEAADTSKSEKDKVAAQKALAAHLLADQKAADRARVAQEKSVQRDLAKAIKDGQRELERIDAKRAKDAQGAGEAARSTFASGGRKFGDAVVGGAMRVGKAAVVGGVGAVVGGAMAFDAFLEKTSELKTFASFTALTTERLQELNFAVEQNGMSGAKFADGIRQFNAGMRESAKGGGKTGAVAEAIKDIGLSFKDIENMSTDEQVFAILGRMNELGPSFARGGAAAKLFGEIAGAEFARVADQGVDALRATADADKDMGFVLESTVVTQGVRVKQQLDGTMAMIGGIKNSIFAELLPTVEKYIGVVREWALANRDLIKTTVVEWLGKIEQAARSAWPDVKALLKVAADMVPVLVKWGPTLLEIGLALKGLNLAKDAAASIKTLSGAFTTAQGSAAAFAGAGGVGAIIQAFLILLPIALKIGNALGDVGSWESKTRATLADKLVRSGLTGSENLENAGAYTDEIAAMSVGERKKLLNEVYSRVRQNRHARFRDTTPYDELFGNAEIRAAQLAGEKNERVGLFNKLMGGKQRVKPKQIDWLLNEGQIDQEQAALLRGRGNVGRLTGARKSEKDDKLSDAELMKLIDKAVQSGANLQDLIGQRKLAGTTPPVITITQHIYNVTATANMSLKMKDGQAAESFAQVTSTTFSDFLSTEIRKALPEGRVAR